MSTTKSLEVALEYSGAQKGNGTVLAMEMSEVDQGAILQEFSQYPGEEETLWNACSYMEALKGKEEWRLTKWGLVKLVYIKINASGRALTVEELEHQRKATVVNMLETIHGDISRYMETASKEDNFVKKATQELCPENIDVVVKKANEGCMEMVDWYRKQEPSWFHANEKFAEAVETAASLPILARSWLECYLEDEDRHIFNAEMWNFHEAQKYLRNLRYMQLEITRRMDDASARQHWASAICVMSDYIKRTDAIDEVRYSGGGETPLLE